MQIKVRSMLNYAITYLHVLETLFFLIRNKIFKSNPIMIITKLQDIPARNDFTCILSSNKMSWSIFDAIMKLAQIVNLACVRGVLLESNEIDSRHAKDNPVYLEANLDLPHPPLAEKTRSFKKICCFRQLETGRERFTSEYRRKLKRRKKRKTLLRIPVTFQVAYKVMWTRENAREKRSLVSCSFISI